MAKTKKRREAEQQIRSLRQQYPTLCPNIIAAQLGLSVITVRSVLDRKSKSADALADAPPSSPANDKGE